VFGGLGEYATRGFDPGNPHPFHVLATSARPRGIARVDTRRASADNPRPLLFLPEPTHP